MTKYTGSPEPPERTCANCGYDTYWLRDGFNDTVIKVHRGAPTKSKGTWLCCRCYPVPIELQVTKFRVYVPETRRDAVNH